MSLSPPRTDIRVSRMLFAGTMAIIAVVYWPMHAAGLVWDDKFYLHDRAWLREGRDWLQIVLHGFPDWGAYFRPLGVALFTAQIRLFNTAPMPMHMTSLVLHLLNTLLVGLVAQKSLVATAHDARSKLLVCTAMLFYGLHPALIEPVAWISSQFDLLVTLFTLLGILANLSLANPFARSMTVAACFFLAACSKESALAFPLLLLIVDWLNLRAAPSICTSRGQGLSVQLRHQWPVYLSTLIAGSIYLAIRYAGLGSLVGFAGHKAVDLGAQLPLMGITYLAYWKLLIWPFTGLGPFHPVPNGRILAFGWTSCAIALPAICLATASVWFLYKRRPVGGLMAGFTAALLPVLHVVPIQFDDSYYHERYATTAIAMACAFLPIAWTDLIHRYKSKRSISRYCLIGVVIWLALGAINIRATLPLWANEVRLWRWALVQNPASMLAKDHLLSTYIEQGDLEDARPLADALRGEGSGCARCMLNVAFLALAQRDAKQASVALAEARRAMQLAAPQHALVMGYTLASGNLDELRQRPADAEKAYRAAIALDPLSPEAYMNLALLQVRQGELDQARKTEQLAVSLSAPDMRESRRKEFDRAILASGADKAPARIPH
ncbi:MAG: tetratricopeptide repeat protein [Rudaea sp.]